MRVRCNVCVGSGKVMGGGMLLEDCNECDGIGKIMKEETKKFVIDKESHHYKRAVKNIKALHPEMTIEEAEKIFDDELAKDSGNDGSGVRKKTKKDKQET